MAHEDSTVNDALAEIYSEVHVAASGKINQRDFAESHLTKDQVDILGPIGKNAPLIWIDQQLTRNRACTGR